MVIANRKFYVYIIAYIFVVFFPLSGKRHIELPSRYLYYLQLIAWKITKKEKENYLEVMVLEAASPFTLILSYGNVDFV